MITTAAPSCPTCGGGMYDNRGDKKSPRAPDFRCKDHRNCDGRIWPPRGRQAAPVAPADAPSVLTPRQQHEQRAADVAQGANLCGSYLECTRFVLDKVAPLYAKAGIPMDAATVAACVATLYIQRAKAR